MPDPTPTERQAAMIADLEARLELANERIFFIASQNAKLLHAVKDLRAAAVELMQRSIEANWYAADLNVAVSKAKNLIAEIEADKTERWVSQL